MMEDGRGCLVAAHQIACPQVHTKCYRCSLVMHIEWWLLDTSCAMQISGVSPAEAWEQRWQ